MKTFIPYFFFLISIAQTAFSIEPAKLPRELCGIAFADETGLITDVKDVTIPNCQYPYNASIIAFDDHYKLFFRNDTPTLPPFSSQIGVISLDNNFDPIEENFTSLATRSNHSEDPRAFWYRGKICLSYSDVAQTNPSKICIHLAEVNPNTLEVEGITPLDLKLHKISKNWTPFVDDDALKYIYYIYPQKILSILEEEGQKRIELFHSENKIQKQSFYWKKCFGQIRGGTPGILISENEFLSFFHSSFRDQKGFYWYVLGAYTFEAKPPYKILRISEQPILFHSIYDSWTYHRNKFCIFPAGLVVEGDRVLVSCGENDGAIKILTFNKEKLLDSFVDATPQSRSKFNRFN